MYTVERIEADGTRSGLILDAPGEPVEYRTMGVMREWCKAEQRFDKRDLLVLRGGVPSLVIHADGTQSPPPGVELHERAICRKGEGPCFCMGCRAERRS